MTGHKPDDIPEIIRIHIESGQPIETCIEAFNNQYGTHYKADLTQAYIEGQKKKKDVATIEALYEKIKDTPFTRERATITPSIDEKVEAKPQPSKRVNGERTRHFSSELQSYNQRLAAKQAELAQLQKEKEHVIARYVTELSTNERLQLVYEQARHTLYSAIIYTKEQTDTLQAIELSLGEQEIRPVIKPYANNLVSIETLTDNFSIEQFINDYAGLTDQTIAIEAGPHPDQKISATHK